ncbi:MAG: 3-dehydroquinate synthase [Pseudobdellovibrio sp.]
MTSKVQYLQKLPSRSHFPEESVLFYDSILAKKTNFKKWSAQFKYKIALKSGEDLKTLKSFGEVLTKITKLKVPQTTKLTFVAVGGGSVGDFAGFVASTFLRGRRLVLIPSTWLSAVDSAHGGKTGLNFLKTKNQIGSFWPAEQTLICKEILATQPAERLTEAFGEIIKIAVLKDKSLFQFLENNLHQLNTDVVFKKLPQIIKLKYDIVKQDPFETKGHRRLLNLGHTMGHVFESVYQWPHGVCVLLGMQFALRWSKEKNLISEKDFVKISELLNSVELEQNLNIALKKLNIKKTLQLLLKDKKLTSQSKLDFIFIKGIGKCERLSVSATEITEEIKRQKSEY